jgi:hypothetical protein
LLGVIGCAMLVPLAWRRRAPCLGFLVAVLLALPVSAAITGALSAPHDRYQSRIMWLPPLVAALSLASLRPSFSLRHLFFPAPPRAAFDPPPQRPA